MQIVVISVKYTSEEVNDMYLYTLHHPHRRHHQTNPQAPATQVKELLSHLPLTLECENFQT